jgi:hypothetical protein
MEAVAQEVLVAEHDDRWQQIEDLGVVLDQCPVERSVLDGYGDGEKPSPGTPQCQRI